MDEYGIRRAWSGDSIAIAAKNYVIVNPQYPKKKRTEENRSVSRVR